MTITKGFPLWELCADDDNQLFVCLRERIWLPICWIKVPLGEGLYRGGGLMFGYVYVYIYIRNSEVLVDNINQRHINE